MLLAVTTGCGSFMARRMVQAPNTYPHWFAPQAPVLLDFHPNFFTNFSARYLTVGSPPAQLCYRIIEPADYRLAETATNWQEHGSPRTLFDFQACLPGPTNQWTAQPRGTVILLHGYALAQFSMFPWALQLAQDGYRCVLVDLRGHGQSSGRQIYYGIQEPRDLSQLLDRLAAAGELKSPVDAMGESYGAVMALRWKAVEPRLQRVVAITPYAGLSNTVLNLRSQYAGWVPKFLIQAGLKKLPALLGTTATNLDTTTIISQHPCAALFVAADDDKIAPLRDVKELVASASADSRLVVVPGSTHETVTYFFPALTAPITSWLNVAPGGPSP